MATEIVFVLDKSGSMSPLVKDVIGGFNHFVNEQKKVKGKAFLTTVLFDTEYRILHDRVNIQDVPELTGKDYYAMGSTALLDAVAKTIGKLKLKIKPKSKVLFIINTDGEENSSLEFRDPVVVKEMIEELEKTGKWKFMFFGAGIDAFASSVNLGISTYSNYTHTDTGTRSAYVAMACATTEFRSGDTISSGEYFVDEDAGKA